MSVTMTLSTMKLSHIAALVSVSLKEPSVVMVRSLKLIKSPWQMVESMTVLEVSVTMTLSTMKLSHIAALISVSLKEPSVVMVRSLKRIKSPWQMVESMTVWEVSKTVTLSTMKLSHIAMFFMVSL